MRLIELIINEKYRIMLNKVKSRLLSGKNIKFYNLLTALIVVLFVSGCIGIYEDGNEMAADAKTKITEITVDELQARLDSGALLIDVRQENEYNKGNIPGSMVIPRGLLEFKIANEKFWEEMFMYAPEKNEEIIIYCKSGARGSLAAETLVKLGYKNVKNLAGGWKAWPQGDEM